MSKDIKKKSVKKKDVKPKSKNVIYNKNMKNRLLKSNEQYNKIKEKLTDEEEKQQEQNAVNYATDKVYNTGKNASINTAYTTKNAVSNIYRKVNEEKITSQQQMKKRTIQKFRAKKLKNKMEQIHTKKETTKKTINTLKNSAKKLIESLKNLGTIIATGGSLAVMVIIITIIIAGMFGSAFGFLFSDDVAETEDNMTVNAAVNFLDNEVDLAIEEIKEKVDYDSIRIENRTIVWREVLSVYAVITTNRETKFDIMNLNKKSYEKLKEIFWKVVDLDYYTERYTVRVVSTDNNGNKVTKTKRKTRLIINIKSLSLDEMMNLYRMNKSERKQVEEMMDNQFDEMWDAILNS